MPAYQALFTEEGRDSIRGLYSTVVVLTLHMHRWEARVEPLNDPPKGCRAGRGPRDVLYPLDPPVHVGPLPGRGDAYLNEQKDCQKTLFHIQGRRH